MVRYRTFQLSLRRLADDDGTSCFVVGASRGPNGARASRRTEGAAIRAAYVGFNSIILLSNFGGLGLGWLVGW